MPISRAHRWPVRNNRQISRLTVNRRVWPLCFLSAATSSCFEPLLESGFAVERRSFAAEVLHFLAGKLFAGGLWRELKQTVVNNFFKLFSNVLVFLNSNSLPTGYHFSDRMHFGTSNQRGSRKTRLPRDLIGRTSTMRTHKQAGWYAQVRAADGGGRTSVRANREWERRRGSLAKQTRRPIQRARLYLDCQKLDAVWPNRSEIRERIVKADLENFRILGCKCIQILGLGGCLMLVCLCIRLPLCLLLYSPLLFASSIRLFYSPLLFSFSIRLFYSPLCSYAARLQGTRANTTLDHYPHRVLHRHPQTM